MAEWGGLENRCAERHPGFESLPLRHIAELNSEIFDFTYSYETYAFGIKTVIISTWFFINLNRKWSGCWALCNRIL